ncbi:NAD(P)H-binding protein [Actinoplanes palleronii]|uniref:NmrA family transcriptional regulator n=1 Tax=Actinoplanes palleronii TaxID=113570 RepID=A0ABQ4BAN6_9ACTN|nr:NAD(P)H-binding protein [Actinoplanes palleronii]GIE67738.1 NmrA family transcriptional regulator [Actinoplanes palleronii]
MIVVTAPTSQIGSQLLGHLLAADAEVRVIARDPDRLKPEIRDRVDVVRGSHGDADVVNAAFDGAESVFWLAPPDDRADDLRAVYLDFLEPARVAFGKRGVARVVGVSALGRGTPMAANAGHVTLSLAMDDRIAESGVAYRALTMPSFMDNLLGQAGALRQGMFFSPIPGDLRVPTCATADIAAVAARELLDDSWAGAGFAEVPVLGPEDLSNNDQARILSEVLGREIRFQHVPIDAFRANMIANAGMSEAVAQGMAEMMAAKAAGMDNAQPRTAANTTPTTFAAWCEETLVPTLW